MNSNHTEVSESPSAGRKVIAASRKRLIQRQVVLELAQGPVRAECTLSLSSLHPLMPRWSLGISQVGRSHTLSLAKATGQAHHHFPGGPTVVLLLIMVLGWVFHPRWEAHYCLRSLLPSRTGHLLLCNK